MLRVVPSVSMGSIVNVWPTTITPGSRLRTCVTTGALWKCHPTPWPTKLGTTPRPYRSPISWMTCAAAVQSQVLLGAHLFGNDRVSELTPCTGCDTCKQSWSLGME